MTGSDPDVNREEWRPGETPEERVEELRREVQEENPDPVTRREAFELDLMEEGLVEEGRDVQVNDDGSA